MTKLDGYIGIDTLTEQIRKKALKQGFEFNVMLVGASGLGKSTLVNTLFRSKVSRRSCSNEEYKTPKTIEIKSISHVIEEKGIRLKLTVTDTPGFGDHVNNENCWVPITKFINEQYEKYLNEEISIKRRKTIPDTRVHCCIYFIAPTGHSLRPLDIEVMKRLVTVVNVIPVIAKSDALTLEERDYFKTRVQEDLRMNNISVYPALEHEDPEDEESDNNKWLRQNLPFAVVGSSNSYMVGGKSVLGRKTKWGVVEVENEEHCEFAHLRNMIIRTHLQDLKDVTGQVHYESYRQRRLEHVKKAPQLDSSPAPQVATVVPTPKSQVSPQSNNNNDPVDKKHITPVKPVIIKQSNGGHKLAESKI